MPRIQFASSKTFPTIIYLSGGLGNQLFQLSVAMAFSRVTRVEISTALLKNSSRTLDISNFASRANIEISSSLCNVCSQPEISLTSKMTLEEIPCCVLAYPDGGEWLEHVRNPDFFHIILEQTISELITYPSNIEDVVVHFRLGDYLFPSAARKNGVLKSSYYSKILKNLDTDLDLIFLCEDLKGLKRIHKSLFKNFHPTIRGSTYVLNDLKMMCESKVFISSNSTLSMWAVWYREKSHQRHERGFKTYAPSNIYRIDSPPNLFGLGSEDPWFWCPFFLILRFPWVFTRRLKWQSRFWI